MHKIVVAKWLGFIYSANPIKSIDIALQAKI